VVWSSKGVSRQSFNIKNTTKVIDDVIVKADK
jgi:hypothetical protein